MDLSDPRTQEEQYLTTVVAAIDAEIAARGGDSTQALRDLRGMDVTDYNARNRILSQATAGQRTIHRLAQQRLSPYFGRVDYDDLKEKTHERIYLGAAHIRTKGVDYVHDWRAPVGELFYQTYGGHTTYRAPDGIIPVNIQLKRRFTIQESSLTAMVDTFDGADPDPRVADNLLAEMLKRSAGTNMGQIVKSIQAEQDAVIRTGGDIVIVQGPAGSGKTVVALHRAAYLLYQMRQSPDPKQYALANSSNMRVFSPNRVFSDYISHVLPDLQEDAIEQDVFEHFLLKQLIDRMRTERTLSRYKVERKEQHFETMLALSDDDYSRRIDACRVKTAPELAAELRSFVETQEEPIRLAIADAVRAAAGEGKPLLSARDVAARFSPERPDLSLRERLQAVVDFVQEELAERRRQLRAAQRTTTRGGETPLHLSPKQKDALAAEIEQITALGRGLNRVVATVDKTGLIALYREFWASRQSGDWATQRIQWDTLQALDERRISYEDIPALVCLEGYYRGFPRLAGTVHAIIDECQDYTPLHYEFLKNCLPRGCRMTIVGDLNQTIDETVSLGTYEPLAAIFPGRTKQLLLTRSYRSSQEITEYASRILGSDAHIDNVRRSGQKPHLVAVPAPYALSDAVRWAVARMQERGYRQIAVVCKTRAEAEALHRELGPVIGGSLLTEDASHIAEGALYVPIAQAKGLEFDAVIVHNAGSHIYSRPADRRLLYTACTRALHDLVLLHTGTPSELLPKDTELFERSQFAGR